MDALSMKLLKMIADPTTSDTLLYQGLDELTRVLDAENRQRRNVAHAQHKAHVASASGADLRKLAQANLARKYK
jgi:hypothetical protein